MDYERVSAVDTAQAVEKLARMWGPNAEFTAEAFVIPLTECLALPLKNWGRKARKQRPAGAQSSGS